MINHSIQSMNLDEADQGEISLPSESTQISFEGNLRQFIILTRRAFNELALLKSADEEGIKVALHCPSNETSPYFGLKLKVTLKNKTVEEFVQDYGDDFFASVLRVASFSTQRGISGKRAVFVREFRRDDVFDQNTISG